MPKSVSSPPNNVSAEKGQFSKRFEVMDELNRHYSERIDKIEKTGCTELVISNLKKWIEALVTHDKVLISAIESLESEALERSEMVTQVCKERLEVEDDCREYKKKLCEKTDLIKELNCRIKEQSETLNQKECVIIRLNEELDKLRKCLDCINQKSGNSCEDDDISKMKTKMECLKKELSCGEIKVKSLEEELSCCQKTIYDLKKQSQSGKSCEDDEISKMKAVIGGLKKELCCRDIKVKSLEEELGYCQKTINELKEQSQHVRYNGRVNELELKLERAREEICCLRKKLETKESELACLKEKNDQSQDLNRVDKVLLPDSMLSLKLEEFQRFTDESGKKLQETIDEIKRHTGNLLLKEDMEELDLFLNSEQETFFKVHKQLYNLLWNIKNSNPGLSTPANYKLQCLEIKLKSALETIDKGRTTDTCSRSETEQSNQCLLESMKCKIKDSLKIICDLKEDAPQVEDSVDPLSVAGSTKLIQEVQEMIKIIQNQSKIQQSRLFAILDNQKEETGSLTKKFSEVDCLLRSHCKSINYVKDELKIALCNIIQKAEKVRKQAEHMTQFECSVKEISNWINCNLKNNTEVVNKVNNLLKNLEQLKCMKSSIEDSQKVKKVCKLLSTRQNRERQSFSSPTLTPNCHESNKTDLNDFEDKCLIARDLCDEVNKELEKAATRINEREHKLTQLSKDISCFGDTVCRLQEIIVRTAHVMSGEAGECSDQFISYEEGAMNLQNSNKQLLQALHNIKNKLIAHLRESDNYDIKGIESRKTITVRLEELEQSLNELSNIIGELKANEYIETTRALSFESVDECGAQDSDLSLVVPSTVETLCQMRRNMMEAACRGVNIHEMEGSTSLKIQMASTKSHFQELKNEICYLNDTINALEKQNTCHQNTIATLKCQLAKTKEEADMALQNMHDESELTRLYLENRRLTLESTELRAILKCKIDKINMLKKEYIQLTDEVNQLTVVVKEEKENSKNREYALTHHNTELQSHNQWLKKKLQSVCHGMASTQTLDDVTPWCGSNVQDDSKRKMQCLQEKYSCLLSQYRDLYNLHGKMQKAIKCSLEDTSPCINDLNLRSEISREDTGCLTDECGDIDAKLNDALAEINMMKMEITQLNCENERLNNENDHLIKDRQHFKQEYDKLITEKQQLIKSRDQYSLEFEQVLGQLHNLKEELLKLREENRCLVKNNELISLENGDLKIDLERSESKHRATEERFKCLMDNYDALKKENEIILKQKILMENEIADQYERTNILRDEECRENLALKQKYEEMKNTLKCAELKIDDLEREIQRRHMDPERLSSETHLLNNKSDQEWNEMYVMKCTEVMELSEEVECLRRKLTEMDGEICERNETTYENKRVIVMLKKTIQDYKAQFLCIKSKLDKCIISNKEMKREKESLEKSNRSLKQFIVFLNQEKIELLDKINRLQSEGSYDDESMC